MDLGLMDKVAIVGGSSKGLGKGCLLRLANEGANVVICSNDKASLDSISKTVENIGVKYLAMEVDMASKKDNELIVEKTISKFGKVDILVNNSGGPTPGSFFKFKDEDWEKAFNDVLMYVVRLIRLVVPSMKENKWGRIINLTSLTVKEPSEGLILSNVFRSGVVSMAKSMTKELIKSNITINNICPGAFKTDRAIKLMKITAESKKISVEEVEANAVKDMPLGRYQTPEELGDLVAFLCSELAKGITGTTLQIDGGISKGLL